MTTYICKCGRTFTKNTEAGTTGFRMPDYGPDHECYGCLFVQKERWREGGLDIDAFACRGSKALEYQTDAYSVDSKGAALHVRTLDLEFIQAFFKDYLALPGHTYEHLEFGMDSPENGRRQYSFGFAANKQGDADRKALVDRYFRSEGERPGALPSGADRLVRRDVTPEQEKEIVLNQITKAKEETQSMNSYYAPCGHKFSRSAGGTPEISVEVTGCTARCFSCPNGLHEPETDEHGPRVMCVCRRKKVEPADTPITLEDDGTGYPEGAEDMTELAGQADLNPDPPETDAPEPDDGAAPESDDAPVEPAQPCDWKNASGGDEDEEDDDQGKETPAAEVTGDPPSLRGHECDEIISTADRTLNKLIAMLHAKKQHDGEMTVKITFEDDGFGQYIFGGAVSGKINYTIKPQKISGEPIELKFDAEGNPIVPADRERQLSFADIPSAGGTATVDGKTGIVEHFQPDGQEEPPAADQDESTGEDAPQGSEPAEKLYPCWNFDCPFYGVPDVGDAGCCFGPSEEDTLKRGDPALARDVGDAVQFYLCTRPEVIQAFAEVHPDAQEDQPPYADGEEVEREDDAS